MEDRIYLGRVNGRGMTYLTKHSWDCGWYWGFGYLGNQTCHWHFESLLTRRSDFLEGVDLHNVDAIFSKTWITQHQWWILRDLFIQAYALGKAAETYRLGGHQTGAAAPYRRINAQRAKWLNNDLEKLLDAIWELLEEWKEKA